MTSQAGDDATYARGETLEVTVTFSEAVVVTGTPGLSIDMDPAYWGEKRAAYASGSGTAALVFTHKVVEPNLSTQGIAVLANSLALAGGTIRSASSQADASLTHVGLAHDADHKVDWRLSTDSGTAHDTTPPRVLRGEIDGATMRLTFSEALDEGSTGGRFRVTVQRSRTSSRAFYATGDVTIDGAVVTVGLGEGNPRASAGLLTRNHALYVRRADDPTGGLRDLAGNPVRTPNVLLNDGNGWMCSERMDLVNVTAAAPVVTAPAVSGVEVTSQAGDDATYALGESIEVTLTFSEAVVVTGTPGLAIDMDPAAWGEKRAAYASGSGTAALVFTHQVVEPNLSRRGIAVLANSLALAGGTIRSASTQADASLTHVGLAHDADHKVDWRLADTTPPRLSMASVDGSTLTLTFDETLAAASLSNTTFAVKKTPSGGSETAVSLGAAAPAISAKKVTLTLASAVATDDGAIKVSYTKPGSGGKLADAAGNEVADFSDEPVANSTPDTTPPRLSTASVDGSTLTLTFDETLAAASLSNTAFAVKKTPSGGSETAVSLGAAAPAISGKEVTLTLASAVAADDGAIKVSYTKPGSGGKLADAAGNEVAGFTDEPVTNSTPDTTPPRLSVASVDGSTLTLTFDETLAAASLSNTAFAVKKTPSGGSETAVSLGAAAPAISAKKVTLTLASAVAADDGAIKVSYTKPGSGGKLADAAGNEVADFSDEPVANSTPDTTPPRLSMASVDGSTLTLTFDETLAAASLSNTAFAVKKTPSGGSETAVSLGAAAPAISAKTATLTLASAVATDDGAIKVSYTKPGSGGKLADAAGNEVADFSDEPVANSTPDTTPPRLSVASVDGSTLTLTFDETLAAASLSNTALRGEEDAVGGLRDGGEPGRGGAGDQRQDGDADAGERGGGGRRRHQGELHQARLGRQACGRGGQRGGGLLRRARGEQYPGHHAAEAVRGERGRLDSDAHLRRDPGGGEPFEHGLCGEEDAVGGSETAVSLGAAAPAISGKTVTLTLASAVLATDTDVKVSYTKPGSGGKLADAAGNEVAGFADRAVTNATAPSVTEVEVTSQAGDDATYALGETIRVRLTFSEAVTVTGTPRLKLDLGSGAGGERWATYRSGSGTTALAFAYRVAQGDASSTGVAVLANTLALNGGTVRGVGSGRDAALAHVGLAHDANHKVDWQLAPPDATAPRLSSTVVEGRKLKLGFNEAIDDDASVANGAFTVKKTPQGGTEESVGLSGTPAIEGPAVTLTLVDAVRSTDTDVKVSYRKSAMDPGNGLRDAAGNEVAGFSDEPVANAADTTLPKLSVATVDGSTLTLTFNETLAAASLSNTAFAVKKTPSGGSETAVSLGAAAPAISAKKVTLTLASAVLATDTGVKVSYTKPGSGGKLADAAGNEVAGFADEAVTNITGDTTPPRLVRGEIEGATVTLYFNEPLDEDSAGGVFWVNVQVTDGHWHCIIATGDVGISGNVVTVGLGEGKSPAKAGLSTNEFWYRTPTDSTAKRLRDLAGNEVRDTAGINLDNLTGPPSVTGVAFSSGAGADRTYARGETIRVTVKFSEAVNVTGTPRVKIDLSSGTGDEKWAAYASGSGTKALKFAYTVAQGDASSAGVAVLANTLTLNGGTIESASTAGENATLAHAGLAHDPNHRVETTPPTLSTAIVNRTLLRLIFNETLGTAASLANGAFTVKKTPQGGTEETVSLSGSPAIGGARVTLTLANAVLETDTDVRVSYTRPPSGTGNRLRDEAGNEVASFTGQAVRTDTTPPTLERGEIDGGTMTLYFSEPLDPDSVGGVFQVLLHRSNWSVVFNATGDVEISGNRVTVGLGQGRRARAGVPSDPWMSNVIRYTAPTDPTARGLQDLAGNEVRNTRSISLDNLTGVAPTVTGVAFSSEAGDDATYALGDKIRIRLTFNKAVSVTGTPRLKIDFSSEAGDEKWAAYASGGGTKTLEFAYTVAEPNVSTQGIAVLANTLELNGGTIESALTAGENAALAHAGLAHNANHKVDGRPALSVADAQANEGAGASVSFQVSLSHAAAGAVTVDYATADGTATAGVDYTATSGTLTFAAGDTAKTVSVPVLDDAVNEGEETFTLALSNATGARIADGEATGTITNDDPLQKMWLSRFGRTVASHVTDAVSDRLSGPLTGAELSVGGQRVDLARTKDEAWLGQTLTSLARALGVREGPEPEGGGWPGTGLGVRESPAASRAPARTVSGRELLLGSAFHLAREGEGGGPGLAAWGRVTVGGFDGEAPADGGTVRIDGEVTTGILGADAEWDRLLAGVAVSLSEGEGAFDQTGVDSGTIESTMTAVSPYARLALTERVSAWGLLGYGTGDMTIVQAANERGQPERVSRSDLAMRLAALGGRGALLEAGEAGGIDLGLKADAFFVETEAEAVSNEGSTTAEASRLRLILEGSRAFGLGGGSVLTPGLELGLRHDGGDAETGMGVELGGRIAWSDPGTGLGMEARVRTLLAHEDSEYREWGASGSLRLDPGASGRGLSFHLAPTWGAASSGAERLWSARDAGGLVSGAGFEPEGRLEGELGYGLALVRRPVHGHAEPRVRALGPGARVPHRLAADPGHRGRPRLRGQSRRHAPGERPRPRYRRRGGLRVGCGAGARRDAARRAAVVTGWRPRSPAPPGPL